MVDPLLPAEDFLGLGGRSARFGRPSSSGEGSHEDVTNLSFPFNPGEGRQNLSVLRITQDVWSSSYLAKDSEDFDRCVGSLPGERLSQWVGSPALSRLRVNRGLSGGSLSDGSDPVVELRSLIVARSERSGGVDDDEGVPIDFRRPDAVNSGRDDHRLEK